MFASSQLDPVIGLDIHMEMVPTPAGPVPTPFPMPFVGIIEFSPEAMLVEWGMAKAKAWATSTPEQNPVFINGLRATKTGDDASNHKTLPHVVIPPGTMWTPLPKPLKLTPKPPPPPPDNPAAPAGDAVFVTGSKTVYFEGLNACRLGTLAMSCGDPVRLPSSTLLAIPKGRPVLVGGPPAFDFTAAAQALFLRNKWTGGLLNELVSTLKPGRLRNLLGWGACHLTGHPVDVATGRLLTRAADFTIRGPIPMTFERHYASSWAERDSPLGFGWSHTFDERVWVERGKVVYKAGDGRELEFHTRHLPERRMRAGDEVFYPVDKLTLRCLGEGRWAIRGKDGLTREFERLPGEPSISSLTEIRHRAGHSIRLLYGADRSLERVETSEGRVVHFEHEAGRLARIAVPHPDGEGWYNQVRFEVSLDGDLLRAIDSAGHARVYRYEWHLLIQETDRDGVTFWFEYNGRDSSASCVRTWGSDGKGQDRLFFREITYDKRGGKTFVEDSLGNVTVYTMNVANAVVAVTDPHGATTTYEYDDRLWKTKEIDTLKKAETYAYDDRGNEIERTLRSGSTVRVEYDANDQPVRMVDPSGLEWCWRYDGAGRLLARSTSAGAYGLAVEYEGRYPGRVIRPDGNVVGLELDKAGNLRKIVSPDGAVEQRWYDAQGRLVKVRDRAERVTRLFYDGESRLRRVEEAGVERAAEYSPEGDVVRFVDAARDVRLRYAGFHQLAAKEEGGTAVRYKYSSEDLLVAIENEAGEAARLERDRCGRVRSETGFDGRKRVYSRDALGRVAQVTKPDGKEQRFAYDAMGNVTRIAYADGGEERFTYTALGALESATNAAGTVRFERDRAGRLIRERWRDEWVQQQLDANGDRIAASTSRGLEERIERSAQGFVRSIEARAAGSGDAWRASFERDGLGREVARHLPGGVKSRWARDGYGRSVEHAVSENDVMLSDTRYRWRDPSTIESIVSSLSGESLLEHDARGRLASVHRTNGATEYRCPDRTGNVYRTADRKDRRYGSGGVLLEDRGTRFEYDGDGNRVLREEPDGARWRYEWSAAGRLRAVVRPDGRRIEYEYDALARRVARRVDGATTRWLWDANSPVHEWSDDVAHPRSRAWLFGPGSFEPIASLDGDGARDAVVCDVIGAPELVVGEAGTVRWSGRIDSYGQLESTSGEADKCPWRFPGQLADDDAGLSYNRFRYYDASTGSYISQDPIRLAGGLELYAYVPDPTTWIDPLGLTGCGRPEAMETSPSVATPYGRAIQDTSAEALGARDLVGGGAMLFKGGRLGTSAGPESQFWSLENPLSPGSAQRYGIPPNNASFDFVETAKLKPGAPFIVRPAPGVGPNAGGALEIVVAPGSVSLSAFSMP